MINQPKSWIQHWHDEAEAQLYEYRLMTVRERCFGSYRLDIMLYITLLCPYTSTTVYGT